MTKFITATQAADLIEDNMTVAFGGFAAYSCPDEIFQALADRFKAKGHPKGLTATCTVSPGDADMNSNQGMNRFAELPGFLDTVIAGHFGNPPKLGKMIGENKIAGYALPLGIMVHLYGAVAANRPAVISHVGLGTYADPRIEGCKSNQKTIDQNRDLVELINVEGKELLAYKTFPIDACIIRGTYADEEGNISMEQEGIGDASFDQAAAAHNSGGIVIVQVKEIVKSGSLNPKQVRIHKSLVDYVVKCSNPALYHPQSYAFDYRPEVSGEIKIPEDEIEVMPLNERKVIARRSAMQLKPNSVINMGIGVPSGVANVANEEGFADQLCVSIEAGPFGGVSVEGVAFSGAINPEALSNLSDVFNLYDGGFLDMTFLGAAQIDRHGNVNVSKFGGRCTGPGGFINITQNTKKVHFLGTFTTIGLKEDIYDGKLHILQEGSEKKFVNEVEQITFSADFAKEHDQEVMFITERAVFKLERDGLTLTETAPGVDLQKDILDQMEFKPHISKNLKEMDPRIFK